MSFSIKYAQSVEQLRIRLACAFRWAARLNLHESIANHFSMAVSGGWPGIFDQPGHMPGVHENVVAAVLGVNLGRVEEAGLMDCDQLRGEIIKTGAKDRSLRQLLQDRGRCRRLRSFALKWLTFFKWGR